MGTNCAYAKQPNCHREAPTMSDTASPVHAAISTIDFTQADLANVLATLTADELDRLEFGVIGIDEAGIVRQYNAFESKTAGLSPERVLDRPLFTVVAPCMNNFMVAHRFEETAESKTALDEVVDYVLTLRMKPIKVRLRLLALPGAAMRYVLVQPRR